MAQINNRLTEREAKARRDALDVIKGNLNNSRFEPLKPIDL
jgi:hypothetical protein